MPARPLRVRPPKALSLHVVNGHVADRLRHDVGHRDVDVLPGFMGVTIARNREPFSVPYTPFAG